MKNHFNKIYLFVLVLFFGLNGYAQLFPVQLTPVFKSPYSVKISDYATSMDTKFQLLINPTDVTISQRQVRLKLYIQGNGVNIRSSDYITGQRPIFINGGEFQTLTNSDISALFRLENLQGITASQYANPLPDGMYDFCFEMYDYITNQKISQKSCASIYLILNDPPLLNTPQKNEQIAASDFSNIMFTWTPRQMNATNVSYKFELKQLIDPTLDPQFAFQMAPLLYEETVFSTAMLYNLSMPILTPGMRYAWRVRAISTTGLSENAIFKNDGYSEIYSFKYTASCASPTFLLSEAQGPTSVKITWQGIPEHTKYQLQYKKQDVRNAQWFSTNSLNTQSLITNLEPGVTYQFRVGSSCDPATEGVQSFTYSEISTFTTPTQTNGVPAYNCGIIPKINIQNQKTLTNLIQSETFTAGDFPVTVLELKGENSPYSGKGYIIVPYLADTKIAVEFSNITINTDYQLISGVVETSYNPEWGNVVAVQDVINDFKGLIDGISDLFDRANKLEEQKKDGTINEDEYNKNWKEIYESLEKTNDKYKILVDNTSDIPEDLRKKIADLDPVFVELASNNFTTKGNQTIENLTKTNEAYDALNKFVSDKCDASLKSIVAFLATEKINYLKLAASEVSKNATSVSETDKKYNVSIYDEGNGALKITHYKDWSISSPVQNLFLIETKDSELNKLKITKFWLSYAPNNVDGNAASIDVVVYFKEPVPNQAEPFCTQKTTIAKGVSIQAQLADNFEEVVFYATLSIAAAEVAGGVKLSECVTGFALDAGFQMGINAIVKLYLNENFTTQQLVKEISVPSAATSCATATLVNKCGTGCAGISGFAVGFSDDVLKQLKSGKKLSEIEVSQSTLNGIKQGILNIVVQKVVTFGISKFSAWRGKYTAKQVEDALEDLQAHPEKYGIENKLEKLWTKIDEHSGDFHGNHATYYDVNVTYQAYREQVGIAFSNNNILEFHLNIPEKLQGQGIGSEIFKQAIIDYAPSKVKGWWKTSDIYTGNESINLSIFKQKLKEGFSPEKAVFETPTGKILKANNFDGTVEILKNSADEVIIYFNPKL
ncbi:fibronectin type III domain-containing protein [Flavobacterium piscisymbiosum]|uniref:Fibronectin type III domain-containing protein n=1 Tax=Flavobacterium piscisymbiosum TaxID=2893753 RepID=A0ABS8MF87_9FLAO|nr:fibronectin type III domain-containing protein [Flavobacterium sp. F-30]MCC9064157.1 fibronectin type III domain-containing protein [Flavobacterium sp. F-30]